jgi:hypothetical protein
MFAFPLLEVSPKIPVVVKFPYIGVNSGHSISSLSHGGGYPSQQPAPEPLCQAHHPALIHFTKSSPIIGMQTFHLQSKAKYGPLIVNEGRRH